LAQKEISADFTATILGDEWFNLHNDNESKDEKRLQKVNDLIQLHSKRFNSAGGGKYRLYHERFRLYILQKVSEQDIAQFNDKFIELCETVLEITTEKDISEKESYALEFISTHYFNSAMQGEKECLNKEQAAALKKHAYDQQFWERQIKASKGFEWSKRMLNEMMAWASKFNEDDEVIECALNKVDLYHQEQNDAPRIVQLVADGDIETALERIEKFGDKDKEGLQRKFILYMLCLMELTLLDSKDKEYAKSGIEKILMHFDENIPANQPELINWNDFFSSCMIFHLAFKWAEEGIDYSIVFKRTKDLDNEFIRNNGSLIDSQISILKESFHYLDNEEDKSILMRDLSLQLIKQNKIDEALECARGINLVSWAKPYKMEFSPFTSSLLMLLSTEFIKKNENDVANILYQEALECARKINDQNCNKNRALLDISKELYMQEKKEDAFLIINESLDLIYKNKENYYSDYVLSEIAIWLSQIGHIKDALTHARKINYNSTKSNTIIGIYAQIHKNDINNIILNQLLNEAISYAKDQKDKFLMCTALIRIADELLQIGNVSQAKPLVREVLEYANTFDPNHKQGEIINKLSKLNIQLKMFDEAILSVRKIKCPYWKCVTLKYISDELLKIGKYEQSTILMDEVFNFIITHEKDLSNRSEDYYDHKVKKERALQEISLELAGQGNLQDSLKYLNQILDYYKYITSIKKITNKLIINGAFSNLYTFIELILNRKIVTNSIELESKLLSYASLIILNNNNLNESLKYNQAIISNYWKCRSLLNIWVELVNQNRKNELDVIIRRLDSYIQDFRIKDASYKYEILIEKAKLFFELGRINESQNSMIESYKSKKESISLNNIYYVENSKSVFSELAIEFALCSNLAVVEEVISNIHNRNEREICWQNIVQIIIKYEGSELILNKINQLKKEESINSFLKSYFNEITFTINQKQIIGIMKYFKTPFECIELYLYLASLDIIFINFIDNKIIDRYNRTLNLQWAIDIKNQLPN
jgi:hypothetical protein